MKKTFLIAMLFSFSTFLSAGDVVRLSEPVYADENVEVFGKQFDYVQATVSLTQLMQSPQQNIEKPLLVKTPITKVCQKKGCFFISQVDDIVVRVSFKDYGFFIPTDSTNKEVTMLAELVMKEVSEEKAAHFEQDLNLNEGSLKRGMQYELVAAAVMIPKST